ncbi:MAG: hypothetical protein QOI76_2281 [Frankiales bacterium]|jgi:hypothetical protein|nr:hypothetical protein [Frankiales bacterium]
MIESDATMLRLGEAIALGQVGDRATARDRLVELWHDVGGEAGDPLHRCAIAHALADVQDDVVDELFWDLQALAAADRVTDRRAEQVGAGPVSGFYPSLHLNLGDCYRRLGDTDSAWLHVHRGRATVRALPDSGYRELLLRGLDRLADRLRDLDSRLNPP